MIARRQPGVGPALECVDPSRLGAERASPSSAWREVWTRLGVCTAAAALIQLDGTVVTVALPSVAHSLRISSGSASVVLSAYFAAYALMLLPGGVLVDRFGPRRLALIGLGLFALGAAGVALGGGAGAPAVHDALLVACAVCLTAGIPACALLGAAR
jgi:MFS family permease